MSLFDKVPNAWEILSPQNLPRHVGIIMDGNGRWAGGRGLKRLLGHRAGMERLQDIVAATSDLGIGALTVYAFSTENWKRPADEVSGLMKLMVEYLEAKLEELAQNNVRICFLGFREGVSPTVLGCMERAEARTQNNDGTRFQIALNYGGRQSVAQIARELAQEAVAGRLDPTAIDPALLERRLNPNYMPPLDLVIRTGGEQRLSNFLLYEAAYAELLFTETFWPDFDERAYLAALAQFQHRSRRFGGL